MTRILGLAIGLAIILGALNVVGVELYLDIKSLFFVSGGAIGYSLMRGASGDRIKNFGEGAVFFGWLGTLIGLVAITGNRLEIWGNVEKMGPALAVAMLTIFYGYIIKLISIALAAED
jgi:flagellar motor component MotA